ncbi:MAG: hypothetical protein AAFW75_08950 [Cyanobacteria bacterium J06636_16]
MAFQDSSYTVADVYVSTLTTGKITRGHRQVLKDAICSLGLDEEELSAIDRLVRSIVRGRLQLEDEQ